MRWISIMAMLADLKTTLEASPDPVGARSMAMKDAMVNGGSRVGTPALLIRVAEAAKQVGRRDNAGNGPTVQDDQTSNRMVPHLVRGPVE
jgi:hypothetical protein